MTKTLYVLALLTMAATGVAQAQTMPPPSEEEAAAPEAVETTEPAESADVAATVETVAVTEPAVETAEADGEGSDKDNYRRALKSFQNCRRQAMIEGGAKAVSDRCGSQRKRMMAAKDSLRGS